MNVHLPEPIRRPLRSIRRLPERMLHPSRRSKAYARLAAQAGARTFLFVCHGNINRSAYAAAAFAHRIPDSWRAQIRIESAGFIGPDRPASELARSVGGNRGVDLSAHRSRLLDGVDLHNTEVIVVMSAEQRDEIRRMAGVPAHRIVVLGDLDPEPIEQRTIQDPYGHTTRTFERVFDRIDRCLDGFTAALWTGTAD